MIYVKDVMASNVRTIDTKSTIREAAKMMSKWKIGAVVLTEGRTPIGIITEGDVSRSVARSMDLDSPLKAFTGKRLVTVGPGERLEVAAKLMADAGVKKLPVMEGEKLVGIVTQTDIVNTSFALVTSLKEMVQARYRPPDFEM